MVGELGIGKTRLLDEVATRTIQDGAIVLRGSASESEGMPPYLPFLEALGRHIRTIPLNELHKQISVEPQALASILPELAVCLGELPVSYPSPPEQAPARLPRQQLRQRLGPSASYCRRHPPTTPASGGCRAC